MLKQNLYMITEEWQINTTLKKNDGENSP